MTSVVMRVGVLLYCVLIGLAGCATISAETPPADVARLPVGSIDLTGRLSVRYQKDGHDEAIHGSFNWSQRGGKTLVTLLSPLGQTLATIDIGPTESRLVQAGLPSRSAADPDALAAIALGWPLPVARLGDWLQGIATDAAGKRRYATPASASAAAITTSDGWQLRYPSWDTDGTNGAHPRRIDLSRSTAQAGDVAIRIVIDSWQPG